MGGSILKGVFLFILIATTTICGAQQIMIPDDSSYEPRKLYRWSGHGFFQEESSVGLMPYIQNSGGPVFGMGISRGYFASGEGGGEAMGATLGVDYNLMESLAMPKLNVWINRYAFIFGGNLGATMYYHVHEGKGNLVIRPEIGVGYLKVFINYGYAFLGDRELAGISKHSVILSYYHSIWPGREG